MNTLFIIYCNFMVLYLAPLPKIGILKEAYEFYSKPIKREGVVVVHAKGD